MINKNYGLRLLGIITACLGLYGQFRVIMELIYAQQALSATYWHLFSSALLILSFFLFKATEKKGSLWPLLLCALCFIVLIPFLGVLAAALLLLAVWAGNRFRIGIYEDYEQYITEKTQVENSLQYYTNFIREMRSELSFEPLMDIMAGQQIQMKIKAITKLSQDFNEQNIRFLKVATHDAAPEIRLYSANALLQLEDEMNKKLDYLKEQAAKLENATIYSELGELYVKYAESGLLEESLKKHYLKLAAEAYQKSLDLDTSQKEVLMKLATSLSGAGEHERARVLMDRAVKIWPDDSNLIVLKAEIYFHLKQYEEVINQFEALPEEGLDLETKRLKELWA